MSNRSEVRVQRITPYHTVEPEFGFSDNVIDWVDDRTGNPEIYAYDLATRQEKRITTKSVRPDRPLVYRGKILWRDFRNNTQELYTYDPNTNEQVPAQGNFFPQPKPAPLHTEVPLPFPDAASYHEIEPDTIFGLRPDGVYRYGDSFISFSSEEKYSTIRLATVARPRPRTLTARAETFITFCYNYRLVWVEYPQFQMPFSTNRNWDPPTLEIRCADLQSGKQRHIAFVPFSSTTPRIWENRIAWADTRTGNWDVFVATLKDAR